MLNCDEINYLRDTMRFFEETREEDGRLRKPWDLDTDEWNALDAKLDRMRTQQGFEQRLEELSEADQLREQARLLDEAEHLRKTGEVLIEETSDGDS